MRTHRLVAMLLAGLVCSGCSQVSANASALGSGSGGSQTQQVSGGSQPKQVSSGGWKDKAIDMVGGRTIGAEHGAIFYAFDTLAYPQESVDLTARVQSAKNLEMIPDVTVGFFRGDEPVGSAVTGGDGLATIQWTSPKAGGYEFEARIIAAPGEELAELLEITPAPLVVTAWPKDKAFVVVDLDHTVVDSSFFRVLFGGAKPAADSVRVMRRIAGRYGVIYLTHRPDLMTRNSKGWLREHEYPLGPLLVSELKEAFGDSGKFKTAKLAAVTEAFPNAKIGIGDKLSDAQAYVDNGLVAYLIPYYKEKPESMREMARDIRRLAGRGRLNVVSNWREIEAGIFGGKKFSPEIFADELSRRADELQARQREKERAEKERDDKRDDDDDDDEEEEDD